MHGSRSAPNDVWCWDFVFDRTASGFRDEFLAMEIFDGVRDARSLTAAWRDQYNAHRPHRSLGYLTPARFAAACAASALDMLILNKAAR